MSKKYTQRPDGYHNKNFKPYRCEKYINHYFHSNLEVVSVPKKLYSGRMRKRQFKKAYKSYDYDAWQLLSHSIGDIWYDPCGGFANRICKIKIIWCYHKNYKVLKSAYITKDDGDFFCGCNAPIKKPSYQDEENNRWYANKKSWYEVIAGLKPPLENDIKDSFFGTERQRCMYQNIPEYKRVADLWINSSLKDLLDSEGVVKLEVQDQGWSLHSGIPYPSDIGVEVFLESVKNIDSYWNTFKNKYLEKK